MNRNRLIIGLFLAVVLALLLATFVYREFNKLAARPVVGATQQIVVAAQKLEIGTRLDQGMLADDALAGERTGPNRSVREDRGLRRARTDYFGL